jgi:AraC-like DNA-binding protein
LLRFARNDKYSFCLFLEIAFNFYTFKLTIGQVSDKLHLQRHTLTEVLNTEIGRNFYQFVNEYRVSEIKKMLANPGYANYSIDAIGYECGFNSKSSFYSVFKKSTGMTPAQYKKSLET